MPKKQKKKTATRVERILKSLPKKFTKDLKNFDRLIQEDPNIIGVLDNIFRTTIKLDAKSRRAFLEYELMNTLGTHATLALRFILIENDPELLKAIKTKSLVSEETMSFLNDALAKYGYELMELVERTIFENYWSGVRSFTSYSLERKRFETRFEILTASDKVLVLDGPLEDMLLLLCRLGESLNEDLENAKKAIPDLVFHPNLKRLDSLQQNLKNIKKLCAST